jgi:hypothetical protein
VLVDRARREMVARRSRRWVLRVLGTGARCSGGCAVMLRQPDVDGEEHAVELSAAQAQEESPDRGGRPYPNASVQKIYISGSSSRT